jgi:hypothetical protein
MNEKQRQATLVRLWDELYANLTRKRELDRFERDRPLSPAEIEERSDLHIRANNIAAEIGELQSRIL